MQRVYDRTLGWALAIRARPSCCSSPHGRAERLPVHIDAQGLLPAAGHRPLSAASAPTRASRSRRCSRSSAGSSIVQGDPAVESVVGFAGGCQTNGGYMFAALKPLDERKDHADQVIARLRPKLAQVSGARVPERRAGHPRRRSAGQRPVPVHAAGRYADRTQHLGTEAVAALESDSRAHRRQLRPAGHGPGDQLKIDRDGGAARPDDARDRQHALRRVRPAPGLDHLQRAQPVPRRHGGRARYWQNPQALNDIYVSTGGADSGAQATAAHSRRRQADAARRRL